MQLPFGSLFYSATCNTQLKNTHTMNRFKIFAYILPFLFLLFCEIGNGQEKLALYKQMAAQNNAGLKATFNEYMAALEGIPQVGVLPDPQIAFAYFIKPVETRVGPQIFKISASQMFPWFGTLQARQNVAIANAEAAYEKFKESKSKLYNDVSANFYNLYVTRKAMGITKANINILASFKNLAGTNIESGVSSAVDLYRIEMEIGELENQLALLIDNEQVMEVMFNNLLNSNTIEPIITPDSLLTNDFQLSKNAAFDSIKTNNHQLKNLALQQSALEYRNTVSKNMGKPNISVGIDYTFVGKGTNMAGTDAILFPSIGVSLPLYRNKYRAMINEVAYLQTAKEAEKTEKVNLLENVFERTWKEYRDAERRIHLYQTQTQLAEKSMSLLETEYSTGKVRFEEILSIDRKILKYNLEYEKAKADKQAAIAYIYYLMGN